MEVKTESNYKTVPESGLGRIRITQQTREGRRGITLTVLTEPIPSYLRRRGGRPNEGLRTLV